MKGVRAYRSRRYTRHSATLRSSSPSCGAPQRFASLYPRELPPLAPRSLADLASPESRTLDISNATSQRGDIRLFRKVVKCTARLRDGGRFWRPALGRLCAISAIGYIVEFHYRIPSSVQPTIKGPLRSRIPVAYSALNARPPLLVCRRGDPLVGQISGDSLDVD